MTRRREGGAASAAGPGGRRRKRRASSARWLARQHSDPYVAEARALGYRSRAAFKLAQLDDRFHFLARGMRVLDLGAAPGGWTQVAAERVGAADDGGMVIAVDLTEIAPVAGAVILQKDVYDDDLAAAIQAAGDRVAGDRIIGDFGVDVVLSDMAAPATGHRATDHLRIIALCETALAVAEEVLVPGGAFVAKMLQGGSSASLMAALRRRFAKLRHAKPAASRPDSAETYIVATGFRGTPETPE